MSLKATIDTSVKAVFLDRDGVLNEEKEYAHRLDQLQLIPGSAEALKLLQERGFKVIVTTNQAGIAYGYYTEQHIHVFHKALAERLANVGAYIDAFYYCPHHAHKGKGVFKVDCQCRKPAPGMLLRAAQDFPIDLSQSFIVGDKWSDIEAHNLPNHFLGIQFRLVGRQK